AYARNRGSFAGLNPDDLYIGTLLPEKSRCTHDCTGRSHGRNKMSDRTLRVAPYLRPRTLIVSLWIVGVAKLVQHDVTARRYFTAHIVDGAFHRVFLRRERHPCSVRLHGQ